jgi:sodium pump decarboxylase gamma subunit
VLLQGLTLTIVGMSVVILFLTILVFIMKLMSAFIPKNFPDDNTKKQAKSKQTKIKSIKNQKNQIDITNEAIPIGEEEIAAVIAAVKSYSQGVI